MIKKVVPFGQVKIHFISADSSGPYIRVVKIFSNLELRDPKFVCDVIQITYVLFVVSEKEVVPLPSVCPNCTTKFLFSSQPISAMFRNMENVEHQEEKSQTKMRRQREDMQVNIAGLRRNIMNLAHNYSDAQIKVREATSNDPWGPSSKLMSEIADLTYNVVAFTEIMQMIWKRLNDHGRNWRHVYKALLLLEYLIKTGSEKVAQQCKENIFAIQTLKDFQHFEDNKDQGINVREKAKNLVALLKDDERLRNERVRAFKAKERFAQSASAFGSDGGDTPSSPTFPCGAWTSGESDVSRGSPGHQRFKGSSSDAALAHTDSSRLSYETGHISAELECARPQTVGEEELQLQLALAMSREEAEQEEQKRRSDDVRLQLALSQSQDEFRNMPHSSEKQSHMLDLLDVSLGPMGAASTSSSAGASAALDPWGMPIQTAPARPSQNDPWGVPTPSTSANDPWAPAGEGTSKAPADPWKAQPSVSTSIVGVPRPTAASSSGAAAAGAAAAPTNDPWSPSNNLHSPASDLDEFDIITNRERPQGTNVNTSTATQDPLDLGLLGDVLPETKPPPKKTPHSFLGENSALVNLDNLVTVNPKPSTATVPQAGLANPFSAPAPPPQPISPAAANLFQQQQMSVRPTINQIRQQPFNPAPVPYSMTRPMQPNPFLS